MDVLGEFWFKGAPVPAPPTPGEGRGDLNGPSTVASSWQLGTQKGHKHKQFLGISPYLGGLHYTGIFLWDIPILIVAYVVFGGP